MNAMNSARPSGQPRCRHHDRARPLNERAPAITVLAAAADDHSGEPHTAALDIRASLGGVRVTATAASGTVGLVRSAGPASLI